jgi:hypothetical protein
VTDWNRTAKGDGGNPGSPLLLSVSVLSVNGSTEIKVAVIGVSSFSTVVIVGVVVLGAVPRRSAGISPVWSLNRGRLYSPGAPPREGLLPVLVVRGGPTPVVLLLLAVRPSDEESSPPAAVEGSTSGSRRNVSPGGSIREAMAEMILTAAAAARRRRSLFGTERPSQFLVVTAAVLGWVAGLGSSDPRETGTAN